MKVKPLEAESADDIVVCYSGLECSFDDILTIASIRNCCLGQGQSYVVLGGEFCTNCVGKNKADGI